MDNNTKDKSELEKTIEEVNNKSLNIPSQRELSNEKSKKEQILDEELEIIREKIKNSNPKWKLENFDEFFYKGYSQAGKLNITKAKIYGKNEYKEIVKISKRLKGNDKNYVFEILTKNFYQFIGFSNELDKSKVEELIKSYIFYSNVKYNKEELKFSYEKISILTWFLGGIKVFILVLIILGIIGLLWSGVIIGVGTLCKQIIF